jgi:hypothetical protein
MVRFPEHGDKHLGVSEQRKGFLGQLVTINCLTSYLVLTIENHYLPFESITPRLAPYSRNNCTKAMLPHLAANMSGDRLSLSTTLTDEPYLSSSSTRSLCSAFVAM